MKIAERTATWRRERRVLRVSRAAWRLDQAERERNWALASTRAEGVSIRALAAAALGSGDGTEVPAGQASLGSVRVRGHVELIMLRIDRFSDSHGEWRAIWGC
jgi:hypothetical protein